jgi:beta-glucanase (GH16 family)
LQVTSARGGAFLILVLATLACSPATPHVKAPSATPTPAPSANPTPTSQFLFDDEFNGSTLSSGWVALDRPGDTSNSELECYRPSNAAVGSGLLVLTSKVDSSCTGYHYTSAMVQWRSFNFLYGTLEIRAMEAGGQGTWPALWLLGADCQQTNVTDPGNLPPCSWPNPGSDEIDVTEILGGNHNNVAQGIHSSNGSGSCTANVSDVSQNWHTYELVWREGSVTWKIDGATTCVIANGVPSHPMFLMMNTAIGGFGGGRVSDASLPQSHSIDYVRLHI